MKQVIKSIFLILCLFSNITLCYAASLSVSGVNLGDDSNNSDSNNGDDDGTKVEMSLSSNSSYTCSFKYSVETTSGLTIDGYNSGNELIIKEKITPVKSIKSGMSIGMRIVETKVVSWKISDVDVTKEKVGRRYYGRLVDSVTGGVLTETIDDCDESEVDRQLDLLKGDRPDSITKKSSWNQPDSSCSTTETVTDSGKIAECNSMADAHVAGLVADYGGSTYVVILSNSNNANDTDEENLTKILGSGGLINSDSNSLEYEYVYSPKAVCMNPITSDVYYRTECNSDEFKIVDDKVNNKSHFHYFVPLNVNDGKYSIGISRISQSRKQTVKWCKMAIKGNSNYDEFLVGSENDNSYELPENENAALRLFENGDLDGCYVQTEVPILVDNGYFRVDEGKIVGFNYYFRQIDEQNPFPLKINSEKSLWYDWYNKNYVNGVYTNDEVSPNIRDSFNFNAVLYRMVATAKYIRNSLKDNSISKGSYIEWDNISVNGVSSVVANDDFFSKPNDVKTYNIGCGPLNETDPRCNQ